MSRFTASHPTGRRKATDTPKPIVDADLKIIAGDFMGAIKPLERAVRKSSPMEKSSAALRLATIPFFELVHTVRFRQGPPAGLIEECDGVYRDVGRILAGIMDPLMKPGIDTRNPHFRQGIGALAESTVIALGAREYTKTHSSLILPRVGSVNAGVQRYASDVMGILLSDVTKPVEVQLKAGRSGDARSYAEFVKIIYVNELGGKMDLLHEESLPNLIIRETGDQQVLPDSINAIDSAQVLLHSQMFPTRR
jgi:hypothetical protein